MKRTTDGMNINVNTSTKVCTFTLVAAQKNSFKLTVSPLIKNISATAPYFTVHSGFNGPKNANNFNCNAHLFYINKHIIQKTLIKYKSINNKIT